MIAPATLTLAYVIDLMIGDPRYLPHPVRMIGWAETRMENLLRRMIQKTEDRMQKMEKLAGVILAIIIVGFTYGIFYFINSILFSSNLSSFISYLSLFFLAYLISTTFATRELIESARLVIKTLNANDIKVAREKLSYIVGRDTRTLDKEGILKATIETLAENASDGIIAPLFYFSIGGLPLAMAYKAVNTLDSMVGYKTEEYKNFGWASAKLDDIANYIPARITGLLIVVSTFLIAVFKCPAHALRTTHCSSHIMLHDGRNHPSPNSGVPEAAMAGALGVRLGGPSFYGGVLVGKPYIGVDKAENLCLKIAEKAITITKITSLLGFLCSLAILYVRTIL